MTPTEQERTALLLDAAETFFKWFENSGSSIDARWNRVPAAERAIIVDKFAVALGKHRRKPTLRP